MMNFIFSGMLIFSFVFAVLTGRVDQLSQSVLKQAGNAVELVLSLLGMLCLWGGIMRIAQESKLTEKLSKALSPVTGRLFRGLKPGGRAMSAVTMNLVANFLGLGNAATPLGIQAICEMRKEQGTKGTATNAQHSVPTADSHHYCHAADAIWLCCTVGYSAGGLAGVDRFDHGRRCDGENTRKGLEEMRMMQIGSYIVPLVVVMIVGHGLSKGLPVFDLFIEGAKDGLLTAARILPALVALMTAVGMFKASGALDLLSFALEPLGKLFGLPRDLLPLALLRPISGSGAMAIFDDLLRIHGPDSLIGRIASVMEGSTETTFYTIAVYYGAAEIRQTRHTVPAALSADLTGFFLSALLVRMLF